MEEVPREVLWERRVADLEPFLIICPRGHFEDYAIAKSGET